MLWDDLVTGGLRTWFRVKLKNSNITVCQHCPHK